MQPDYQSNVLPFRAPEHHGPHPHVLMAEDVRRRSRETRALQSAVLYVALVSFAILSVAECISPDVLLLLAVFAGVCGLYALVADR